MEACWAGNARQVMLSISAHFNEQPLLFPSIKYRVRQSGRLGLPITVRAELCLCCAPAELRRPPHCPPARAGTVAGAREAACKGVPALAVSLDTHDRGADYDAATVVTVRLVQAFLATSDTTWLCGTVLNVNIPHLPLSGLRGFILTRQVR